MTDNQNLLAEYARNGSDAAFRELVTRYVALVYSTALRLVEGDTHRAEDVTQTVFVNLARKARTLPVDVRLGGWLHRDTCLVAGHTLRGERRRQARERQAVEMNALQNHSEADFSQVAPLLDEAINELDEADRTAILLRFYEQQDFRSVGQALGSNEDAARMRVTRALEKLEDFLKRRGVTTTAASLGVVLAANAVQAAPVGLAVTISTAAALAGTTLAATATAIAIKTIAMTTLQKTIITATLAAAVGTGIYEVRQAATLRAQVQTLQQQQAPLAAQIQELQHERDVATQQLAALRDDNERLNRNTAELLKLRGEVGMLRSDARNSKQVEDDPVVQKAREWKAKETKLRQLFDQKPDQRIPEMQLLADEQWLSVAQNADLDSPRGIRLAMSRMREVAILNFATSIQQALHTYMNANKQKLPDNPSQLSAYFKPPMNGADSMLLRYEMLSEDAKSNAAFNGASIIQNVLIDKSVDNALIVGLSTMGFAPKPNQGHAPVDVPRELLPVLKSYMDANNHKTPRDFDELKPYLTTPEQQAALDKFIKAATE